MPQDLFIFIGVCEVIGGVGLQRESNGERYANQLSVADQLSVLAGDFGPMRSLTPALGSQQDEYP